MKTGLVTGDLCLAYKTFKFLNLLAHLFKEAFDSVEPAIPLINSSLISGYIPAAFKHAVVQPLIKKNLDPAVFF